MIVIPMAGQSRRFAEAGYVLPKYMLSIGEKTVFSCAVNSFKKYFQTEKFVFIARDIHQTHEFIIRECKNLGIVNFEVVILEKPTAGQAETVELGVALGDVSLETPLTIFNIDTFRKGFTFPDAPWFSHSDGYIEVFKGSGQNWSYVAPASDSAEPRVIRTTEKDPISDLCCDGLYHFRHASDFMWALEKERTHPSLPELYVAPLYNHLIKRGSRIYYELIAPQAITFCGVPKEYHAILDAGRA